MKIFTLKRIVWEKHVSVVDLVIDNSKKYGNTERKHFQERKHLQKTIDTVCGMLYNVKA